MKSAKKLLRGTAILALGAGCFMLGNGLTATEAQAETYTFKATQVLYPSREFGDYYKSAYLKCTLYKNQNQVDILTTKGGPHFNFRKLAHNNYISAHRPTTLVMNTTQPAKSYWCRMVGVIRSNNNHQDLPGIPLLGANSFVEKKGNF